MRKLLIATLLGTPLISVTAIAGSRDYINIVGSSTVYPFATVVAEQFGKTRRFKTPKIESTGTGGGFKLFCAGIGVDHPDISNASRRIKKSELDECKKNGIDAIVEVKIGYDGIVIANSQQAPALSLTRRDLFLALAKTVPDPKGDTALIANPYVTWKDVNSSLPNSKIEVLGPPPTSGTRDAFVELVMDEGCNSFPAMKALKQSDPKQYKTSCQTLREDGSYVEAGENDNLIVQKLISNPKAVGIFGFSSLDQNRDKIQGSKIEGQLPNLNSIADSTYPVSRPLFFYVKKAHVDTIPGIREYVAEFTSDRAIGDEGYLYERGLIPLHKDERGQVIYDAKALKPMSL